VWFGGNAEPTLCRIGRIGDGWLPQRGPDDVARAMIERIHRYAKEAGRAVDDIGLEPRLTLATVPEPERADFVAGWRALGATHLCVNTMCLSLSTVDEHLATLERTLPTLNVS
jgi:alkanesulfonate monooxygenase SsuD/methylene tetrahydromethanopterin reductase-like flavin-dependent oxidoreductase (luciferase family)